MPGVIEEQGESLDLYPRVGAVRLTALDNSDRTRTMERLDAYAACTQYNHRRYDWDGRMLGYGENADISPGFYVPLKQRRPKARYELAKLIVNRLTSMTLGSERWPEIKVAGDPEAEDFCKGLIEASNLQGKLQEARRKGGSSGTAVLSWKLVDGRPRVQAHAARHIHVLRWVDRDEHVIGACLKVYSYTRTVWNSEGNSKKITLYSVRFWDEDVEIVWDPIPEHKARTPEWVNGVPSYVAEHGCGECPVYWAQNIPESEHSDGLSDFEGLTDQVDEINELLSATSKGTKANVDPTLVIKDEAANNPGMIRKGSGFAIFAPNGAEYLEIKGEAVRAAKELCDMLSGHALDVASVVLAEPEDITGAAQSAAAMRMLYQPMLSQCDVLRQQYGELLKRILRGMLRAARMLAQAKPGPVLVTADGRRVQKRPVLLLPPRFEEQENGELKRIERVPGVSEEISLDWPPYFKATAADIKQDVEATNMARGRLVKKETAVRHVAHHFGVKDPRAEAEQIEAETEVELMRMVEAAPEPSFGQSKENDGEKRDQKE